MSLKKVICVTLSGILLLGALSGCGENASIIKPQEEDDAMKYNYETRDWAMPEPARVLDVVRFNSSDTSSGDASARVLQGVINKKQPRVYIAKDWIKSINAETVRQEILKTYGEVELQELVRDETDSHQGYSVFWTLFSKYHSEIERIFVYTNNVDLCDTINVAAMLAGRNNGVAVDRHLADQIIAAGYDLPVIDVVEYCGFTAENANAFAINQWICDHLVESANNSIVVSLTPMARDEGSDFLPTYYDFAVATDSVIYNASYIYLDKGKKLQQDILDQYPDNTPVIGWPGLYMEGEYVTSISQCGKMVVCADWGFDNGSVWAAFPQYTHPEPVTPIPETYEVKDTDVYVSFMVSDGDAWHFTTGDFLCFWNDPIRGTQPIGWTIPVLFTNYNPLMLEYIYDTATPMDNLMQGPSGISYIYPSKTPADSYSNFLDSTKKVFADMGISMVNVWDPVVGDNTMIGENEALLEQYIDAVQPDALFRGHDSYTGSYRIYNNTIIMEEVGNFNGRGAMNTTDIINAIDTICAKTEDGKPTFLMINVEAWGDCTAALQPALDIIAQREDADRYHFLTPAELVAAIETYEGLN